MSSIDAQKFQALTQAFNQTFSSGTGFLNYPSPMPEDARVPDDTEKGEENQERNEETAQKKEKSELNDIQKQINSKIQMANLTDKLETSLTDGGLLITIRDNVLFSSGSAEVRAEDLQTVKEISELLILDLPRNIIISGHTDNVPINNSEFESNWELSVMRAINVMKIVLKNENLDPRLFSAKGFGEFRPIGSNDSVAGRAKNRRVEILILPISTD